MIMTYEGYLPQARSLSFEEMTALHEDMIAEIGDDEEAVELYDELVEAAVSYSPYRAKWRLWDTGEKADNSDGRTDHHNMVIIKCDQLARYLRSQGKAAEWRETLGYEEDDRKLRKRIGDFACYIVFIESINAR